MSNYIDIGVVNLSDDVVKNATDTIAALLQWNNKDDDDNKEWNKQRKTINKQKQRMEKQKQRNRTWPVVTLSSNDIGNTRPSLAALLGYES